jgi:hypothetical protein
MHKTPPVRNPHTSVQECQEHISPEIIGRSKAIVRGKHTRKTEVLKLIEKLGYKASYEQVKEVLARIKAMESKGVKVMGSDLIKIIEDVLKVKKGKKIVLKGLNVVCGKSGTSPHASIRISLNGEDVEATALGKGPFDASIKALKNALKEYAEKHGDEKVKSLVDVKLVNYKANAIIDDKAIEYISTYTKYFTYDNKAMFLQAQINFDAGNYLETIKIINKLFEQTKATPEYYHLRAIAYLNANSYQLAYNDFSMCLDLNPTLTDNYYYRGIASLKMQQINNACADWYSAIEHKDYRANDYYYQYCKEFEKNLKK